MDTFLLQDWITIQSATAGTLTQAAPEWLDLEDYQDVVIWLEVEQGSATLNLQTSPARDERLFLPVARKQSTGSSTYVLQVGDSPAFNPNTNSPAQIARWLRWSATSGTANWTCTFRVTVMANRQGRG